MTKADQCHVVHNPSGGWGVKSSDASRAFLYAYSKLEAESRGRSLSRNRGTEPVVHKLDGTIFAKDSHGHDPFPPRG